MWLFIILLLGLSPDLNLSCGGGAKNTKNAPKSGDCVFGKTRARQRARGDTEKPHEANSVHFNGLSQRGRRSRAAIKTKMEIKTIEM